MYASTMPQFRAAKSRAFSLRLSWRAIETVCAMRFQAKEEFSYQNSATCVCSVVRAVEPAFPRTWISFTSMA